MNEQRFQPYPPQKHRVQSQPLCLICGDPLRSAQQMAKFAPCYHDFHLDCAIIVITSRPGPNSRHCPVCFEHIIAVIYGFKVHRPSVDLLTHVLGSPVHDSGLFIRPDETVEQDMPELEKMRRRRLRKVRLLDDYVSPKWEVRHMGFMAREGDKMLQVERHLSFEVRRELRDDALVTASILSRSLSIKVLERGPDSAPVGDSPELALTPENWTMVRKEINELWENLRLRDQGGNWETAKFKRPKYKILRDEKGFEVESEKYVIIEKTAAGGFMITQSTTLTESFPVKAPPNWAHPDYEPDILDGKDRAARRRAISLARQEIQGVFEILKIIPRNDVKDLDASCSSILGPIKEQDLGCEYCEVRHRNGDCKLPKLSGSKGY